MVQQLISRYGFWIALLAAVALHAFLWGDLFVRGAEVLLNPFDDGAKNVYTFAYHILHGEGVWFTGMNYPYGDHLLFADAMPFFSVPLSFLQGRLFTLSLTEVVGLFNGLLFASMIASVPLLYLLLRAYRLPAGFSVLAALSICLLQPQFARISGHYSLSMMYWIPLVWYLLLRTERAAQKTRWAALLGLLLLVHLYIHPYLGMIAASFILGVYLIKLFTYRQAWWREAWRLPVIVLPLAIFQGIMHWTNPHPQGRQSRPWGFWEYQADINGVLLPPDHFFRGFLTQFIGYPPIQGEGRAYVGFLTTLGLLFLFGYLCKRLAQKRTLRPWFRSELSHFFLASVLLLLFSMGVPFRWGLQSLTDHFSFIRQFRAVGRFAWPFFYTSFVAAMLFYYKHLRLLRIRGLSGFAGVLAGLLFVFLFAEAKSFATERIDYAQRWQEYGPRFLGLPDEAGNTYHVGELLQQAGYEVNDFQAILPVPFENVGSEEITYQQKSNSIYMLAAPSLQTGLPAFGLNMSRAVLERAFNQQRLVSTNPEPNPLLADLPSRKPVLMVVSKENPQYINRQEQYYLAQADTIAEHPMAWLLKLDPLYLDSFPASEYELLTTAKARSIPRTDAQGKVFYAADSSVQAFYQSFPGGRAPAGERLGAGAYASRTRGEELVRIPTAGLAEGSWVLTLWSRLNTEEAFFGSIRCFLLDERGWEQKQWEISLYRPTELFRDWVQARDTIKLDARIHTLVIRTDDNNPKVIDELLLRPAGKEVWYPITDSLINYNGQLIHRVDLPDAFSEPYPGLVDKSGQ